MTHWTEHYEAFREDYLERLDRASEVVMDLYLMAQEDGLLEQFRDTLDEIYDRLQELKKEMDYVTDQEEYYALKMKYDWSAIL